jgi:hypothetical protein
MFDDSVENYARIIDDGFVDSFVAANGAEASDQHATWDPENPLNSGGHYAESPRQRIDHVFVREGDGLPSAPRNASVVFDRLVLPTSVGSEVTVSDHYGILVEWAAGQP